MELETKTERQPTKDFSNKPEWNILMMSIAFFFVFSAFRVVQAYATSYDPTLCSISFAIIYIEFALLSPFAPLFVNRIGFKFSLLFSFTSYSLYIFSYYIGNQILILTCSCILGFGGAFKAVIQGAYIAQCANVYEYQHALPYYSQIGWFKSLFYLLYSIHVTVAFVVAALFFTFYDSSKPLFLICSVIAFSSLLFIFVLRPMEELELIQNVKYHAVSHSDTEIWSSFHYGLTQSGQIEDMTPDNSSYEMGLNHSNSNSAQFSHFSDTTTGTGFESISNENSPLMSDVDSENMQNNDDDDASNNWKAILFEGWTNGTLRCLVFITVSYGLNLEFFFGELPTFIDNTARTFYVLCVAGITGTISTLFAGIMVDKYDASALICVVACICNVIVFAVLLYGDLYGFDSYGISKLTLMYIISGVFGASGYLLLNQQSNILFAKLLGNQPKVFAKRAVIAYVAISSSYFYRLYIPMYASIVIIMICNIIGAFSLFLNEMNRNAFRRNIKQLFVN